MSKLGMLVGAGVGYVLGARDGRERYEQIRQQAQRVWKDPRVQQKKDQATEMAKQKGGELQDKAGQKAAEQSSSDSSASGSKPAPATPTSVSGSQSGTAGRTTTGTSTTGTSTTGTSTTGTSTPSTPSNGAAGSTPGQKNG